MPETKLAETCACGAQFSVSDNFRAPSYVYEELEKWRKGHATICPLRQPPAPPPPEGATAP